MLIKTFVFNCNKSVFRIVVKIFREAFCTFLIGTGSGRGSSDISRSVKPASAFRSKSVFRGVASGEKRKKYAKIPIVRVNKIVEIITETHIKRLNPYFFIHIVLDNNSMLMKLRKIIFRILFLWKKPRFLKPPY